jgi:hypothetical protein
MLVDRVRCFFVVCRLKPNSQAILIHIDTRDLLQGRFAISNVSSAGGRPTGGAIAARPRVGSSLNTNNFSRRTGQPGLVGYRHQILNYDRLRLTVSASELRH